MLILSTGPRHTATAVAPVPPPPEIDIVGTLVYPAPPLAMVIPVSYTHLTLPTILLV